MDKKIVFDCACEDPAHRMVLSWFSDSNYPEWNELYIEHYLYAGTFWERLKGGIQYILGINRTHGDWDDMCLFRPKVIELRDALNQYLEESQTPTG